MSGSTRSVCPSRHHPSQWLSPARVTASSVKSGICLALAASTLAKLCTSSWCALHCPTRSGAPSPSEDSLRVATGRLRGEPVGGGSIQTISKYKTKIQFLLYTSARLPDTALADK